MHIPGGAGNGEFLALATALGEVIGTKGDVVVVGMIEKMIAAAVETVVPCGGIEAREISIDTVVARVVPA